MTIVSKSIFTGSAAIALCLSGGAAAQNETVPQSQEAPPAANETVEGTAAADGTSPAAVLDPITVTAIKRQDDLSTLPVSVTVIDGGGPISSATDPGAAISRSAPNFSFGGFGQPGNDYVIMRGIGPLGQPSNSLDNTVGFATNGVGTSAFGYPPSLLDVERIEVLRGPQGTLFGRNALGGLVNVVTAPADGEREIRVTAEAGTDRYVLGEGKIGGWLSEGVMAGRAAIRYQDQDGDIPNVFTDQDEGGVTIAAARGTLRYTPNESFVGNLVLGYDRDERSNNQNLFFEHPDFPTSGLDSPPNHHRERREATLDLSYKFDSVTFTSVTNFQRIDVDNRYDLADALLFNAAFGFAPLAGADLQKLEESEDIFSQEFRLSSPDDEALSWVTGVHYFRSDYDVFRDALSSFSQFASGVFDTEIVSHTSSIFGDVSVPVTSRLTVAAGLRASHDYQELDTDYRTNGFPGTVASFDQSDDVSDTYLTGRLAVSYQWNEELMTYASIARGYASGGFQRQTINAAVGEDTEAFDPSTNTAFEIGAKSSFLDDKVEVNVSAFYNDIKRGQLVTAIQGTSSTVFEFVNQDYETAGFELETRALVLQDLFVTGGLGYTYTRLGNPASVAVTEGNDVPGSPKWTANASVDYFLPFDLHANAQYQYVGERAADVQNSSDLDDYHIVNARLAWGDEDFSIYGFVTNLLDERPEYFRSTFSDSVHAVSIGPGRTFGVGLSKAF